jgi:hypothetical protein
MSRDLQIALQLKAETTQLVGGLGRGRQAVHSFTAGVKKELAELKSAFSSVEGKLAGLGFSIGAGAFVANATKTFAQAEYNLREMGNAGELSKEQLAGLQVGLLDTARQVGKFREDLIAGISVLVGSGEDFNTAVGEIGAIGYAATASGAQVDDLAKATYALRSNLALLPKDVRAALNVLTVGGFEGAFELKDMARYLPTITAQAQKLNLKGVSGAASLAAGLQVARLGAGTQEEAATNFSNFLSKLTSQETVKNFEKKFGVEWTKTFKKIVKNSEDPLLDAVLEIKKAVGTDPFKLGELFGDMQVMNFLNPMIQNIERYKAIRVKELNDQATVDKAWSANMATSLKQWDLLKQNIEVITQKSESLNAVWKQGTDALKSVNQYLNPTNTSEEGPVKPKEVSLEKMVGYGAGGVISAYALSRILPPAVGKLFGSSANLAAGITAGKALEKAVGVTPVFVTNWPGSAEMAGLPKELMPTSTAGKVGEVATGVAGGSALGGLLAKLRTSAAILAGTPLRTLPMYGAGAVGTAAAATVAAGAAGYGAGTLLYESKLAGTEFADTVGEGIARVLALFGNEDAKRAIETTEKYRTAAADFANKISSTDLGGTLTIKIDSHAPARVTGMSANSPGMRLNVDTGPTMVLPQ